MLENGRLLIVIPLQAPPIEASVETFRIVSSMHIKVKKQLILDWSSLLGYTTFVCIPKHRHYLALKITPVEYYARLHVHRSMSLGRR